MQPPRPQLRNSTGFEFGYRIFVDRIRQQHPMADRVVAENVEDRAVHPAVADVHTRRLAAELVHGRTHVGGMLEKCDPRFVPQSAVQKHRRIYRGGEHRGRERLRPVVGFCELAGADLQVHLKARIAELDECVLQDKLQFVAALDVDKTIIAVKFRNYAIYLEIARVRREIFFREVGCSNGRKDAGQNDVRSQRSRRLFDDLDNLAELRLHPA